jgi:dipeptidyl aminopeptidase/acylaminoacyl peptidase
MREVVLHMRTKLLLGAAISACLAFAGTAPAQTGRIAFARSFACDSPPTDNCPAGSDIDSVRADGTSFRLVERNPVPTIPGYTQPPFVGQVRYSPDGTSLLIRTPGGEIGVARADGSDLRLAPRFGCGTHPALCFKARDADWSPDGRYLLVVAGFNTPVHTGIGDLYTMRRDGSALHRLTKNASVVSASWSSRDVIAYAVGKPGSANSRLAHGQIVTIGPRRRPARVLFHGSGSVRKRDVVSVGSPVWAPDGAHLLFSRARGASRSRWVLATAAGGMLGTIHIPGGEPAWSPDGKWIAATDGDLWVTRVRGGTARRIVGPDSSYVIASPTWQPATG